MPPHLVAKVGGAQRKGQGSHGGPTNVVQQRRKLVGEAAKDTHRERRAFTPESVAAVLHEEEEQIHSTRTCRVGIATTVAAVATVAPRIPSHEGF